MIRATTAFLIACFCLPALVFAEESGTAERCERIETGITDSSFFSRYRLCLLETEDGTGPEAPLYRFERPAYAANTQTFEAITSILAELETLGSTADEKIWLNDEWKLYDRWGDSLHYWTRYSRIAGAP